MWDLSAVCSFGEDQALHHLGCLLPANVMDHLTHTYCRRTHIHTVNSSQPIQDYCNHEYWCTIAVVAILFRNDGTEIYSKQYKMKVQGF